MLKFGTAGVRAKINELTPLEAYKIVFKISQFFGKKVCIGRDARINGRALYDASEAALLYLGKEVYSLGLSPTPTTQYYLEKNNMDMGIVITASHNPPEWNGIKVIRKDNVVLPKEEGNPLLEKKSNDKITPTDKIVRVDANTLHALAISKYYEEGLNIAVDYGNGVGKLVFGKALDVKRVRRKEINYKIDGNFPGRNSEPTESNLKELISIMQDGDYDLGIAFDGDADRVAFVDEKGEYLKGDESFALLAKYLLEENENKKVVSTVATGRVVDDVVKEKGGEVYHVKVGTTYIAEKMKEENALIGGEEAGGIIYAQEHLGKDGMLTAMLLIKILKQQGKKLSDLRNELPKYYSIKGKVEIRRDKKEAFMDKFRKVAEQNYDGKINDIDGIRMDFEDAWFIVRPSGTEDYIRYFIESKNKIRLEKLKEELEEFIKSTISSL